MGYRRRRGHSFDTNRVPGTAGEYKTKSDAFQNENHTTCRALGAPGTLRSEERGMSKYNARRCTIDGIDFPSLAEGARYRELKLLVEALEITDLRVHPRYTLQDGYIDANGAKVRPIVYEADFEYREPSGRIVVEDVKGVETPVFRLKAKLFRRRYPELDLRVIPANEV